MSPRRILIILLTVPALVAGTVVAALAQTDQGVPGSDIPSVGVLPVGTGSSDPNAGQWFIATLSPGQTGRMSARIFNPATVDQTVRLYLADLDFGTDFTPLVADVSDDVGAWGAFDQPTVTVPARQTVVAEFSMTAPEGAEPGDHVGAVVAESRPQGTGDIRVVKRVATRLYVTIPGDAQPQFTIENVDLSRDSSFFTREMSFTVVLRNTGRVRLRPTVEVDGHEAKGSELLMSRSVEPYTVTLPVPIYGGPLRYKVTVESRTETHAGPTRTMRVSSFAFPWVPLIGLLLAGATVFLVRRRLRRRVGRYDALRADLRRLEKLVAGNAPVGDPTPLPTDTRQVILAAIKRASRAGDAEVEGRLREKLDELDLTRAEAEREPADLGAILKAITTATRSRQEQLVTLALAHDARELRRHRELIATLPQPARRRLQHASRLRARTGS